MKHVNNTKETETVELNTLKVGDGFYWRDTPYIKIKYITGAEADEGRHYNVVNLVTGETKHLADNTAIRLDYYPVIHKESRNFQ